MNQNNLEPQNTPTPTPSPDAEPATKNTSGQVFRDTTTKKQSGINKTKKLIVTILVLVVIACMGIAAYLLLNDPPEKAPDYTEEDAVVIEDTEKTAAARLAQTSFGINLIKELDSTKVDVTDSTFISPASVSLAMSMANLGAAEETKQEISQVLNIGELSDQVINATNSNQIKLFQKDEDKIKISIANSFWADEPDASNDNFTIKPKFTEDLKKYYLTEANVLDLQDPNSKDTINNWVTEKTQDKIPEIIADDIPDDYRFYLINAVYFKGSWKYGFDADITTDDTFTDSSGKVQDVPFMSLTEKLKYYQGEEVEAVQLPYGDNSEYAMDIFLPDNMSEFIAALTYEKLGKWQSDLVEKEGTVKIPKFKMEYSKRLNEPLTALGMETAFSNNADFSGISETPVKIDEVLHKTFLEVNEDGTEAAAVTSVGGAAITSVQEPKDNFFFKLEKPFFMLIKDTETNTPLFMGVINSIAS